MGTANAADILGTDMCINGGCLDIGMTQQLLYYPQVCSIVRRWVARCVVEYEG